MRIDYPGGAKGSLEELSWDEFFAKFDEEDLAFLYQDRKANGEQSTFKKFEAALTFFALGKSRPGLAVHSRRPGSRPLPRA